MDDTTMPKLTLTPDLSVTPEAPVPAVAAQPAAPVEPAGRDMSMLSTEARQQVEEFAKSIDLTNYLKAARIYAYAIVALCG